MGALVSETRPRIREVKAILITVGAGFALFGLFMIGVGASDLEADYVNVGTILGRDTPEPRVKTVTIGALALVVSALMILAAGRRRRDAS